MENFNKKDLLYTIEKQTDEISRYKSRLRDVITAYKGLQNEKEALEASFKAISITSRPSSKPTENQENLDGKESSEDSLVSETNGNPNQQLETTNNLKIQLSTLMNSLATLSAEKSRMEASFQADKKQLRSEKEEREKKIKDLHDRLQNMTKQRVTDVETIKSRLIIERHEREKEQNDHAIMIRELQKLITEDRRAKERLENQVDDLRSKLSTLDSQSGQSEHYELAIRDLRNELESTRRKLSRAESKANETPPILTSLQSELSSLRDQHQVALAAERRRAAQAEETSRRLSANHEERVASLEARLAELSNAVGSYDRLRQQDQQAIDKLKQQIAQLDGDAGQLRSRSDDECDDTDLKGRSEAELNNDVQLIITKINQLKAQLVNANARSEKPIDVAAALNELPTDVHRMCIDEYQQLELKFELFKLKAASVPTSNARKAEEESFAAAGQQQLSSLKERNKSLTAQLESNRADAELRIDQLRRATEAERVRLAEKAAAADSDHKRQTLVLEEELKKQRERSMAIIEEKDQEILTLKSTFQMFVPGHSTVPAGRFPDDVITGLSQLDTVLHGPGSANGGGGGSAGGGAGGGTHMLHYAHELSRRDVEISALRKGKHALESQYRELQREASRQEEKSKARVKSLQDEVGRFQRCQSRESANLEYLKNVVLSFLLSKDSGSKQHMTNAIAAVLKFSAEELEKVTQSPLNASGHL